MYEYVVIGIQHRKGTYEGKDFDNMIFSCIRPADNYKEEQGEIAALFKVKTSNLKSIPQLQEKVMPIYDQYRNVIGFL